MCMKISTHVLRAAMQIVATDFVVSFTNTQQKVHRKLHLLVRCTHSSQLFQALLCNLSRSFSSCSRILQAKSPILDLRTVRAKIICSGKNLWIAPRRTYDGIERVLDSSCYQVRHRLYSVLIVCGQIRRLHPVTNLRSHVMFAICVCMICIHVTYFIKRLLPL